MSNKTKNLYSKFDEEKKVESVVKKNTDNPIKLSIEMKDVAAVGIKSPGAQNPPQGQAKSDSSYFLLQQVLYLNY